MCLLLRGGGFLWKSCSVLCYLIIADNFWTALSRKCKVDVNLWLSFVRLYSIRTRTKGRSSLSKLFLRKGVLKIYSEFTGECPCRSATSIKLQSNFIEIAPLHGCSPLNLLQIFGTPFLKKTSGRLLLAEDAIRCH